MQQRTGDTQASASMSAAHPGYGSPFALPGQQLAAPAGARMWPTLHELANALKRRLVLATFLGILVGMAAAAAIWLAMPAGKHQARALIQVKPNVPLVGKNVSDPDFENFKQTQQTLIRTRRLLGRVHGDPKVARLQVMQTADDPVRFLEEAIRIRWEAPEIMAISMNGDDPNQLKIIVDTLIDKYLEDSKSDQLNQASKRRADLEKLRDDINKKIEASSKNVKNIVALGGAATPESIALKIDNTRKELDRTNTEIARANTEIRDIESRLIAERGRLKAAEELPVEYAELEKLLEQDEILKEKVAERKKLLVTIKKLQMQVPETSPLYQAELEKYQKLDAELKVIVDGVRPALEAKLKAAKKKEVQLKIDQQMETLSHQQRLLAAAQEDRKKYEEQLANLERLHQSLIEGDEIKQLKEQKAMVELELNQLIIRERSETRIIRLEEAVVILNQNLRQKMLLAAAAFLAGIGIIMVSVAFLEWRSRRIDSVQQVVDELGLRVIGTIPAFPSKASLRSGDASQTQNWRFVLNESVNSVRTMLLHTAKAQNMQVLMVSSAMQGEGKTSLASQLATSMATAGLRTLILDCDLRNPSLHKLFDAPLTPGCSEVLCQEVDVSDAVQPTTVPNLWLIPAGQCSNRVIASLAQGHPLETLFNRLRGQFDFIVVDSCPILPVADALLVGQHVDGVVISVLQDISQLPKVMTASDKLTALNIPLLGAVVNGIKADVHAYGYNYVKQLPA